MAFILRTQKRFQACFADLAIEQDVQHPHDQLAVAFEELAVDTRQGQRPQGLAGGTAGAELQGQFSAPDDIAFGLIQHQAAPSDNQ